MKQITIKDLAGELEVSQKTIKNCVYSPRYKDFFTHEMVLRKKKRKNGARYTSCRKMVVLRPECKKEFIKKFYEAQENYLVNSYKKINAPTSNFRNWTLSSAECFYNKMECSICQNWGVICHKLTPHYPNQTPPMKTAVRELYRNFGKPPQELLLKLQNIA